MTIGTLWRRFWYLVNRSRIERELMDEMASHREMMGEPRRFGNLLRLREESRDAWGWGWLDRAWQDLRYAGRGLRRDPWFTVAACLILSGGIGLNLTFFHLLNVAALRPPAIKDADSLVRFDRQSPTFFSNGVPYPATQFIRQHNTVLSAVLTRHRTQIAWGEDATTRLDADFVSANWFDELGYRPQFGRFFRERSDERTDVPPIAVISHVVWQTRLGGAADVVGRTIHVNDRPVTVIGVAPADFPGMDTESPRLWLLIEQIDYFSPGSSFKTAWGDHNSEMYGRLRPGVSAAAAQEGLRSPIRELARVRPNEFRATELLVPASAGDRFRTAHDRQALLTAASLIGGLTLLVLVVASANLANVMLSRSIGRVREFSIRVAVGATRWRIFRHLLVESSLLAILGAAGGIAGGLAGARLIAARTQMPPHFDFAPDWSLCAAALGTAFVAMAAFGLVPAWLVSRRDLSRAMRDGGEHTSAGLARARIRSVFVGAQITGCCALLVVAGGMGRSLQRLLTADHGFRIDHVAVLDPDLSRNSITGEGARAFWAEVRARIGAHPDVAGVALAYPAPLSGTRVSSRYNDAPSLNVATIDADASFFSLMDIPLVAGRGFQVGDDHRSAVVISQRLATAMYGSVDVIGRGFPKGEPNRTIVGVAADARVMHLRSSGFAEQYSLPDPARYHTYALVVRTRSDPARVQAHLQAAARAADSRIMPTTYTLRDKFAEGLRPPRFASLIATLVGLLVLALACLGIFGVVAYAVVLRMKELGIRRALGAETWQILTPLLRYLTLPAAVGVLFGMGLGFAVARVLERDPFNLAIADATAPAAALVVFGLTAVIAALLPASRALRSDPLAALRHD